MQFRSKQKNKLNFYYFYYSFLYSNKQNENTKSGDKLEGRADVKAFNLTFFSHSPDIK